MAEKILRPSSRMIQCRIESDGMTSRLGPPEEKKSHGCGAIGAEGAGVGQCCQTGAISISPSSNRKCRKRTLLKKCPSTHWFIPWIHIDSIQSDSGCWKNRQPAAPAAAEREIRKNLPTGLIDQIEMEIEDDGCGYGGQWRLREGGGKIPLQFHVSIGSMPAHTHTHTHNQPINGKNMFHGEILI